MDWGRIVAALVDGLLAHKAKQSRPRQAQSRALHITTGRLAALVPACFRACYSIYFPEFHTLNKSYSSSRSSGRIETSGVTTRSLREEQTAMEWVLRLHLENQRWGQGALSTSVGHQVSSDSFPFCLSSVCSFMIQKSLYGDFLRCLSLAFLSHTPGPPDKCVRSNGSETLGKEELGQKTLPERQWTWQAHMLGIFSILLQSHAVGVINNQETWLTVVNLFAIWL